MRVAEGSFFSGFVAPSVATDVSSAVVLPASCCFFDRGLGSLGREYFVVIRLAG